MAERDGETYVIVNAGARRGARLFSRALDELRACDVRVREVDSVRHSADLRRALARAVARGARQIIVGGGDGTVNAAANALAGKEIALGVLPLGTGNDFARTVGIPLDLPGACRALAEGDVRHVDLGWVNGRYFVNAMSIGFTAHAARSILPGAKRRLGRAAYLIASARALLGYRGFHARLWLDGRQEEFDALELVIGNGRFHGAGVPLAPDASIVDGRLVFYAYSGLSRWQTLKMALLVYRGRHPYHRQSHFACVERVEVETDPRAPMLVDGDRAGHTPAAIRVVPRALAVVAPREHGNDQLAVSS